MAVTRVNRHMEFSGVHVYYYKFKKTNERRNVSEREASDVVHSINGKRAAVT